MHSNGSQVSGPTGNKACTYTAALAPGEIRTHEAGAWTFELKEVNQVGFRITGRHNGAIVADRCRSFRTETEALIFWGQVVEAYAAPCERTTVKLQYVTVTLAQLETGVWRVECSQGSVLTEWSRSYADRDEAVEAATRAAAAFRAHGTAEGIERRAEQLRRDFRTEMGREVRGMHSRTRMDAIERELDMLADLGHTDIAALAAA